MLPRESLSSPLTASENQRDRPLPDQVLMWAYVRSLQCAQLCAVSIHCVFPVLHCLSSFFWKPTQKWTFLLQASNAKVKSLNSLVTHGQVSHHLFALKTKIVSCWCFIGQQLHYWAAFSPAHMHASIFSASPPYHGKKEQRHGCASSERKFID